jgi:hypothetical protein
MDSNIHHVTGIRIEKDEDSGTNSVDIVIEYQELVHSTSYYNDDEELFGHAKLEHTITVFIDSELTVDDVLWKTIAGITSKLVEA